MDINVKVKSNISIRAFYLFFIITSLQLGVGVMGVPRFIYLEAGADSWISVLIATSYILVVLFVMIFILKQYDNADIFGIHRDLFGKWLGNLISSVYIIYFIATLFSVLITYIEVVRIFIFPTLSPLVMGLLMIILAVYSTLGGLRIMVGVCFLFFILTHWLLLLLIEPAVQIDWDHFLPMFQTPMPDLLKGARATSYTFFGIEILFLIYPFIQNKKGMHFPIYMAAIWSGLLVMITTIITLGFFSGVQVERREWTLLSLFKFQQFSFIERLDFVVVAEWMMVIIPNIILLLWGATYGIKRVYKLPQKVSIYALAFPLLIGCWLLDEHFQIQWIIDKINELGFWLVYVYPFLLLPLVLIKKKWKQHKRGEKNAT
ncbi:GerAB/ArcD/ProY family transporter [Oceanobacillus sp. M65]|uniref:GerAB/ArcD/ProY family transporter n=1 Tax=Oceanobacillus sp. M65 TaxID=3457435 RepID=UPI003FCC5074